VSRLKDTECLGGFCYDSVVEHHAYSLGRGLYTRRPWIVPDRFSLLFMRQIHDVFSQRK
jgi:hypothetical protein